MNTLIIFLIFRIILFFIFPTPINYSSNQLIKGNETPTTYNILMYQCDICYDYFVTREDLIKHLEYYHPQKFEDIKNLPSKSKDAYFTRLIKKYEPPVK